VNSLFQFVLRHGYSTLFAALFVHQIGFPLPGPMLLLSAGALAAAGKLGALAVVGITVMACVSADWIWYEAGRRRGDRVLHFMHRLTTHDADFHDRRAKRIFARHGLPLLLVAKFIPGLDAVAPPLAGISCTSRFRFLAFDTAGAGLYACAYGGLGYAFSHSLDRAAAYVSRAGELFFALAFIGICIYAALSLYRRWRCARSSQLSIVPAIQPVDNITGRMVGGPQNGD
jgi:membrane protein DedA with SNARE-associated domain